MTITFWLIFLAVLGYGLLHSLLASPKTMAQTRHWFGSDIDRWFRIAYDFVAAVTLLPILFLPILLPVIYLNHYPWIILTAFSQLLAVVTLLIGLCQTGITSFIGVRQQFLAEDASPPRLVTSGIYRYVRYPLYLAGLVFIWLIPYLAWNLLA